LFSLCQAEDFGFLDGLNTQHTQRSETGGGEGFDFLDFNTQTSEYQNENFASQMSQDQYAGAEESSQNQNASGGGAYDPVDGLADEFQVCEVGSFSWSIVCLNCICKKNIHVIL
jgi:hypothetical protein